MGYLTEAGVAGVGGVNTDKSISSMHAKAQVGIIWRTSVSAAVASHRIASLPTNKTNYKHFH